MGMRVVEIGGIWAVAFAGAWGLLRVVADALAVPGAHPGADAVLALFVSLPFAILTGTAIAIRRQVAGETGARPFLSGGRALGLALGALAVEALLLAAVELRPGAILQWGVFAAWIGVMLGAGGRLAEVFGGLSREERLSE